MSAFLDECDVRVVSDNGPRTVFKTLAALRFQSDELGVTLVVPANTVTDGASIPAALAPLLGATSIGFRAATLHDHLCASMELPRAAIDRVFREALIYGCDVPIEQAESMYAAVRIYSASLERHTGGAFDPYIG